MVQYTTQPEYYNRDPKLIGNDINLIDGQDIQINNYGDIIKSYNDLFTLHKNSLSVCLHVTYIVILLYLLSSYKHRPINKF